MYTHLVFSVEVIPYVKFPQNALLSGGFMWLIILLWIVVGCVIGLIVEDTLWPSRFGLLVNIVVGAVGALVGGYVNQQVRFGRFGVILLTVLGALLFLWILRWFGRGKQTKPAESDKTKTSHADSSTADAIATGAAVTGAAGALAAAALSDAEATETKANTPPVALEDALLDVQLPEVKSPTGAPLSVEFPDVNAGLQETQTAVASQVDDLQARAEAKLDELKTDLEAAVPNVQLPDAELPAVHVPAVELPDVNAKISEVQAGVAGQGEEVKATIEGQLADAKTGLEAILPDVQLPEAKLPDGALPETHLPEVNVPSVAIGLGAAALGAASLGLAGGEQPAVTLPDVELPDVNAKLDEVHDAVEGQLGAVKTELETALPNVQLPEAKLPDWALPAVELPDVNAKLADVQAGVEGQLGDIKTGIEGQLDDAKTSLEAALPGVKLPEAKLPDVTLPDVELPEVNAPTVAAGLGIAALGDAGLSLADGEKPELVSPGVELPDMNAKLADVQADVEGQLDEWQAGLEGQLSDVKTSLEGALPGVQLPEATLPAVTLPTVELPDVHAKLADARADVQGQVDEWQANVEDQLSGVKTELEAALPSVELPEVTLPAVTLPDVNAKLADVQADIEGQLGDLKTGIEGQLDEVNAGVEAALPAMPLPEAALPDGTSARVELPTVELPDVSAPAVAVGISAIALDAAGLDLADSEAPNVTSPSVDLPEGNAKLAEVQTGSEGQHDEWQAGVEAPTVAGVDLSLAEEQRALTSPAVELPTVELPEMQATLADVPTGAETQPGEWHTDVDTQVDLTALDAVSSDVDSKVNGGQAASASEVADLPATMHEPVESTTVDVAAVLPEGQPLTAQLSTSEGAEPVAAFETPQIEPEGALPELQPSDSTTGALATGLGAAALGVTIWGAESRPAQAELPRTTVLDASFVSPSDEIAEPGDNNTVEGALPGVELPGWEAAAPPEEQVETKVTHGVTPLTHDASTTSLFDAGDDISEGWGELAPTLPDLLSTDAPAPIEHAQLVESKASAAGVQPDASLADEQTVSLATQDGGDATGVEAVLPDGQPTEAVTPSPVAEQSQVSGAMPAAEAQPAILSAVPTPPTEPADVIGTVASAAPVLPSESRAAVPVAVGVANEPKEKPVESTPGENYPDDLTEVLGIGRVYEQKLYQHGIFTFAQLAEADPRLLKQYTDAMDASNVGDWPRQAARLVKKHKRENAYYSGPVPDKFANIPGISESTEQRLYMLGLFTYEQLAAASVAQVETILTPAQRIAEVNVAPWIAKAAELARKKE